MTSLQNCARLEVLEPRTAPVSDRPYVAVASLEGALVNQHLGEASRMLIYAEKAGRISLVETRPAPAPGGGNQRWSDLAAILCDCRAVLVHGGGRDAQNHSGRQGGEPRRLRRAHQRGGPRGLCRKGPSASGGAPPAALRRRVRRKPDGMRINMTAP